MKYLRQFAIIMFFTLAGELCQALLPLPIPGSIYGMVLLLLAFALKILKVEAVKDTGSFLVSILPVLFVAPAVGLVACWDLIRPQLGKIAMLIVISTVITFAVSGLLTKMISKGGNDHA